MSTTTTNYGLIKPDTTDPILIGQLNDNADTIDATMKSISDALDVAKLGIKYKGEVNYYADLPNSAEIGDAYTVKYAGSSGTTPDGTEYVWGTASGTNQWINFSKDSYTKAEVDALLALKQNALSSTQLDAVNSGIDSEKVSQIETNQNNILLNWEKNRNVYDWHNKTFTTGDSTTVTGNNNGTYTVTKSATTAANSYNYTTIHLEAGSYVITGCPSGYSNIFLEIRTLANQTISGSGDSGSGSSVFTITTSGDYRLNILLAANVVVSNIIFKPMITPSSVYYKGIPYQPYAMSNAELTAAIQALQAQLANQ